MALAVTRHLGFGFTCNLTYEPPYTFARRMSTLDHLTKGRIGWNVVTGYLDSAARGMGLAAAARARQPLRRGRGIHARWSTSCGKAAGKTPPSLRDRADAAVRRPGADPSRQARRPALQGRRHPPVASHRRSARRCSTRPAPRRAGANSPPRHAECIFVNGQFRHNVREIVADIRARAKASAAIRTTSRCSCRRHRGGRADRRRARMVPKSTMGSGNGCAEAPAAKLVVRSGRERGDWAPSDGPGAVRIAPLRMGPHRALMSHGEGRAARASQPTPCLARPMSTGC